MKLQWTEDTYLMGIDKRYSAFYPWNQAFNHDGYIVYSWKKGWAYDRPDHPILGKFTGREAYLGGAKSMCEADFAKQVRLRAWITYMLANDPPEENDE